MTYLISQILLSLLFTAALALIAGWLLRGISVRMQLEALARERDRERERANALAARVTAPSTPPPQSQAQAPAVRDSVAAAPPGGAGAEAALSALHGRLGELDAVARGQAARIAELGQQLREKDELLVSIQRRSVGLVPAQSEPASVRHEPSGLLTERPAQPDRLQAISGIGPVLERVLNELGIYRFDQLARLKTEEVEWLARRIDWFPQRIQREDWVGQARRLHQEMHPDEEV